MAGEAATVKKASPAARFCSVEGRKNSCGVVCVGILVRWLAGKSAGGWFGCSMPQALASRKAQRRLGRKRMRGAWSCRMSFSEALEIGQFLSGRLFSSGSRAF